MLELVVLLLMLNKAWSDDEISELFNFRSNSSSTRNLTLFHETRTLSRDQLENQCQRDLFYTWQNRLQPWAKSLIDSCAKPENQITQGNANWFGDYDTCLEVQAPNSSLSPKGFKGKYVWATWVYLGPLAEGRENFHIGMCIPSSCEPFQFLLNYRLLLNTIYEEYPEARFLTRNVKMIDVYGTDPPKSRSSGILFLFTLGILASLVLLGTFLDSRTDSRNNDDRRAKQIDLPHYKPPLENQDYLGQKQGSLLRFLCCFSAFKNFSSLMDTTLTPGQISCVHGIRFISMAWIVIEHIYINCIGVLRDVRRFSLHMDIIPMQIITEGHFGVDTFFLMSGFLQAYIFMRSKSEMTCTKWMYTNIHRYFRISPAYFFVIFFGYSVMPNLGSGPFWTLLETESAKCGERWWAFALYISNFFSGPSQCLPWLWYLPNDMQMFFFAVLLLCAMKRYPVKGLILFWIIVLSLSLVTFYVSYEGKFERLHVYLVQLKDGIERSANKMKKLSDSLYTMPYARAGPYLVGILYGYCLSKKSHLKVRISKVRLAFYWFLSVMGGATAIFGMRLSTPGLILNGLYFAAARHLWGAVVGWVIYACATGHGGAVNRFLSWKVFYPLSRLCFCSYLIHSIFIHLIFFSLKRSINYNFWFFYIFGVGVTTVSLVVSFVLNLLIELPLARLEKNFLNKK